MPVSPLQRTPYLSRLLAPEEAIVYTAKLHPLHGWPWLLGALLLIFLAWQYWVWFLIPAGLLALIYWLPFHNHEMAVTTHRLLLRHGRFGVHLDDIDPSHLDHYQFHQNILTAMLHCGHIILHLKSHRNLNNIHMSFVWHPMSLLEALTTLNPTFRRK